MVDVSVAVNTLNSREVLGGLFDSLDRQSLPVSAFEVVVIDEGSDDQTADLLDKLAATRPNVSWVRRDETDPDQSGLERCSGDYLLHLDPGARLFPQALERLTAWARVHDLDAVAGRAATAPEAVPALFLEDSAAVDPEARPAALAAPALLIRRAGAQTAAEELAAVGVLGSYPVLTGSGAPDEPAADLLVQDSSVASWSEGRLRVEATGTFAAELDAAQAATITVLVRSATSGVSYVLPAAAQLGSTEVSTGVSTGGADAAGWMVTVELDPATAALGEPLPHDTWELDLQLSGPEVPRHRSLTVGGTPCPAALLPLGPVVLASVDGRLQLDVGPTRHPLISDADPAWSTITESAAGTLLVMQLPEVYVAAGAPELEGYVALGSFRLRAWVSNDGEHAWLRSYLSGLAGVSALNAMFGDCPAKPTGLELTISDVGVMTLARPAPPAPAKPAPKPAAKKAAAKKPAAKKPAAKKSAAKKKPPVKKPSGPVAKLRRAVPAPLEPAIRRIAAVPAARNWYRRLTKL